MRSNWLFLILVLGLVLRLFSLNQSLWLDEAISVQAVKSFSYLDLVTKFSPGDFHPPLYYLMLKLWTTIFSTSEISARLLSVIFGVGTIYFLYKIGEKLFNRYIGITCLFLMTVSPLHIYYSQEARMYVPAAFFATSAIWFFTNLILSEKHKLSDQIFFVLSLTTLIYTSYTTIFLVPLFPISLALEKKNLRKNFRFWLSILFITCLLALPLIPLLSSQLKNVAVAQQNVPLWWEVLGKASLKEVLLVPVKFMLGRISFVDKQVYATIVIISSFIFAIPIVHALKVWKKNKFVWLWFLVPLLLSLLQGLLFSGFSYFRLIFLLPPFYLLLSVGLFSITQRKLRLIAGVGIAVISLFASYYYLNNPNFYREDWRSAVAYVESNSRDAVSIFVTSNQRDPYVYYAKSVLSFGPTRLDAPLPDTIWLFRYVQPIFDQSDALRRKIESLGYIKVDEKDFNGVTVWEYFRHGNFAKK